jgi:NAD dependent epimerase/dehydratase family enzyme
MSLFDQMLARYSEEDGNKNATYEVMQEIILAGLYRGGFFNKAAFYGGTCLRIFHGMKRFSEDMDFSLVASDADFQLEEYFPSIINEFNASAIGYYGSDISQDLYTEDSGAAHGDFLSRTCRKWEQAAFSFQAELNIRTVVLRTGFVISKNSEAFRKMVLPTRFGLGAPIGSGRQYLSWIHIEDLCHIYLKAIEDSGMKGVYNAVSPEFISNADFMHTLAKVMRRPFFMPNLPAFLVRLVMGEAASIILGGSRISSRKIQDAGYQFLYDTSEKAIGAALKAIGETEKRVRGGR